MDHLRTQRELDAERAGELPDVMASADEREQVRKDSEWRPAREESGWTEEHRAFRDWLIGELRTAGCEIRTLSPEGMAQVTVEHMVREGWEARRAVALNGAPDVAADLAALALARTLDEACPSESAQRRPWCDCEGGEVCDHR